MIRTTKLNRILEINIDKAYAEVQGGITLNDLHAGLSEHGLCMINCGSISEQTLAGVITTATHGSGIAYGVLSTHVLALTLMLADGSRVRCSRDENEDLFLASLCGLGSTGLILSIRLEVERTTRLREECYTIAFDEAVQHIPNLVHAAEHVRFWWFPQADSMRVSSSSRSMEPVKVSSNWLWDSLIGYHVIQFMLFIGIYWPSFNWWTGLLAAWLASAPVVNVNDSWRIHNVDCRYKQYTTEWSIPYENTQACLREIRAMLAEEFADPNGIRPHFPIEVRFTNEDGIWLSPSQGRRSCWIGIIQFKPYGFDVPYRRFFARFEDIVIRHSGRPHWAKAHPLRPAQLRKLYPHMDDFVRVLKEVDPSGMLRNPYVDRHLFGVTGPAADDRIFEYAASGN